MEEKVVVVELGVLSGSFPSLGDSIEVPPKLVALREEYLAAKERVDATTSMVENQFDPVREVARSQDVGGYVDALLGMVVGQVSEMERRTEMEHFKRFGAEYSKWFEDVTGEFAPFPYGKEGLTPGTQAGDELYFLILAEVDKAVEK